VAIINSRLERSENGQVTFGYRHNRSQQLQRVTLPAQKFIHRFLLHVLPRGCAKVRYYGICSPACRAQLEQARTLLGPAQIAVTSPAAGDAVLNATACAGSASARHRPLPVSARAIVSGARVAAATQAAPMTINSPLPRTSFSPLATAAALLLLARQSVTALSRTALLSQFVKEWVLLRVPMARHCEAIVSRRSDPGRPLWLKPALRK
jgi:hypothetical protein